MGIESPILSAVMARLPDAEINLAAFGGIVLPIIFLIESPILSLLSSSTALCKDWKSYQKINHFMLALGGLLTVVHILIAFTPLYYFVAETLIGAPPETIEPGRVGLMILTPWAFSIGYRRLQQGIMIRFNNSQLVGVGTLLRLIADVIITVGGYFIGGIPGIVVASLAQSAGVVVEAAFVGICVRPIIRRELRTAPPVEPALTWREFTRFYVPLAINSVISLAWTPIGSAAISRMKMPLESLAAWPVVSGLVFMLRGFGFAVTDTVVSLLDRPHSVKILKKFTLVLMAGVTIVTVLATGTPFAQLWFGVITGLNPFLVSLSILSMWLSLPIPGLTVFQSIYLGAIINGKKTRGVPEAMVAFLVSGLLALLYGVVSGKILGLYVASTAFTIAITAQTAWLWFRGRPVLRELEAKEEALSASW